MKDREHTLRRRVRRDTERKQNEMKARLMLAVIVWLAVVSAVLLIKMGERKGNMEAAESAASFRQPVMAEQLVLVGEPEPVAAPAVTVAPAAYYPLTDSEREWVEWTVAAESANQSLEGQMAVCQCILNTARARDMRPDAVVQEANQYAAPRPDRVTDSVREAVSLVFDRGLTVTDEPIRWFYAPRYSAGAWHESALEYVVTIGGHRFFKEVGA